MVDSSGIDIGFIILTVVATVVVTVGKLNASQISVRTQK